MSLVGLYVTCDDAVCLNHDPGDSWPGFEGWEEPLAIFSDTESDTPTHCSVCEALIPHALTPDGYAYVAEKLSFDLAYNAGRPEIYSQWWDQYGMHFDEAELRVILIDAIRIRRETVTEG